MRVSLRSLGRWLCVSLRCLQGVLQKPLHSYQYDLLRGLPITLRSLGGWLAVSLRGLSGWSLRYLERMAISNIINLLWSTVARRLLGKNKTKRSVWAATSHLSVSGLRGAVPGLRCWCAVSWLRLRTPWLLGWLVE